MSEPQPTEYRPNESRQNEHRTNERRTNEFRPVYPNYADAFCCIGSACEDTCCQGWTVPVDEAAYQRYQELAPSHTRTLILESLETVVRPPKAEHAKKPSPFAIIRMNSEHACPMLSDDHLCRIQSEYGAEMLSHTCATYPRVMHAHDGAPITALTLSCPEAARLVLLRENLLGARWPRLQHPAPAADADQTGPRTNSTYPPQLTAWTEPIRATVLTTVTNRRYPIWQRLFLLSVFSKRLDTIVSGELDRTPDAFLTDFNLTAARGSLRVAMDTLPANPIAQMDAVLRLAGLMLHRSNVTPRFVACIEAFTSGIGNGPGATLATLATHSRAAHERTFAPFFYRHPFILENYLVNLALRLNFPFGSAKDPRKSQRTISQQFAILAAEFALIRGLLIGVAGHHGDSFSADHVVHTVQAASKHFEHHPEFTRQILELLAELGLSDSQGLTILLRDPLPARMSVGMSTRTHQHLRQTDALRPAM